MSFTFVRSGSPSLKVEQFDGRNAFSLPAKLVRRVYDDLSNRAPERIVHELQEINEETGLGAGGGAEISFSDDHGISPSSPRRRRDPSLGPPVSPRTIHVVAAASPRPVSRGYPRRARSQVLLIAIVSDINGLELCLVSSEAFEPAIAGAANFVGPDYEQRTQLALDYADKVAAAKADAPSVFGWAEAPEL